MGKAIKSFVSVLLARWAPLPKNIKVFVIAGVVLIVGFAIGLPSYGRAQERKEMRLKYEEFVFEADQLAKLTSYGVNKMEFTRQLARAEAKWDAVPAAGFPTGSYGYYFLAISRWQDVVRYWNDDSAYMRDQVPYKMSKASEYYNQAKGVSK